ncbi:hypothetical protein RCJ22_20300 [Vibrio sp. FNV 38]|nr:hypothetical protein [Vibrio sp. FNV 38]
MRSKKICSFMYKLLIEKELDGFSVLQLRDAAQDLPEVTTQEAETRKLVYRQILRFTANGWLEEKGKGREKRYYKTASFYQLNFDVRKDRAERITAISKIEGSSEYQLLNQELSQHQGELEIILGEIDEYQSLKRRFPHLEEKITTLLEEARVNSARILGRVKGISKLLSDIDQRGVKC